MQRKNYIEVIVHIIFWIIAAYFFVNISYLRYRSLDISNEYLSLGLIIGIIYINYFILIPLYFSKRKLIKYFSFMFILIMCITFIEFLLIQNDIILFTSNIDKSSQSGVLQLNLFGIFFRDTLFVAFFTMFKIYSDAIKAYKLLQLNVAMEREHYKTLIEMAKTKVNTHFFFNTLNSIYSLALDKSDTTPEAVINLSDLMEYVVADSENERVPLESEINFLKNYISLESLKYPEMNLSFEVNGDISQHNIPPMIFESFVNNAFKYTDIHNKGYIKIQIDCNINEICFACKNEIDVTAKDRVKSTSKGMTNTINRLNLHYKGKHLLDINSENNVYKVKLVLKNQKL